MINAMVIRSIATASLVLAAACSEPREPVASAEMATTTKTTTTKATTAPAPPPPPSAAGAKVAVHPQCAGLSKLERLELAPGQTKETTSGLAVTFRGSSHDSYGDGRFEVWLQLDFRRGDEQVARRPSALAPGRLEPLLGHCWKLVESPAGRVVIEVALMATETSAAAPSPNAPGAAGSAPSEK